MVTICTQHDESAHKGHLFAASCPTRDALALIGEKWSVMVLILLSGGPWRFGNLKRAVQGISQKMLTQTFAASSATASSAAGSSRRHRPVSNTP